MALEGLNLPVEVTRQLTDGLATVGIQLPLAVTQLFLLVLSLAALVYGIRRLRREGASDLPALLLTVGFGLFVLGVLFAWGEELLYPLPGELSGRVERLDRQDVGRFEGVRVALLNGAGEKVSREMGILDDRTGLFVLHYAPVFADPPRTLRVTAPDCLPLNHPLQRSDLLQGSGFTISYRCQ